MMLESKYHNRWKILFTIPNFDTAGSGRALFNIVKRLDKNYFEPHISCSHSRGSLFEEIVDSGVPVHLNKNEVEMIPRISGLIKCYQLSHFFKNLNIDLIHSFHYGPDYSEALAAKIAGIPWIFTKKNMNWGGKSRNGWRLRTMLASYIIAQNNDMIKLFFKGKKNISLVNRGVDMKKFSPQQKNLDLVKNYNIINGELVILCVANITPVKGIELLLESFNILSKQYDSIKLFIVGHNDSDYANSLEQKAKKSQFSSKIYFTGKVQKVIRYYSIADIFVLPTIQKGEGCPVSLLEAMACDLPVVASNVSGIKDILSPFPELLFSPGDSCDLAYKIDNVFKKFKGKKTKPFRKYISDKYNIDKETSNHERIYKLCIKK